MSFKTINPATGEKIQTYEEAAWEQIKTRIEKAHETFQSWRKTPFAARSDVLKKVSVILLESKNEYGRLMAIEMGKPVREGRAEIEKCAWVCDYFGKHAEEMLAPEDIQTDADRSYISFQPLGIVLAVMPWNYPFWQVFRFAAPALMAGNAAILKHASNVPGCAAAIERIFKAAGLPEHLFQSVLVSGENVGKLIQHPLIRAVTVTGSTAAGSSVASKAGRMLKKTVLELGGSDPYLILEDADLEQTVAACVAGRLLNSGQSCIAAKRFVVVESLSKDFERLFVEQMRAKRMGDPMDESVEIGPLARLDLRDNLHRQVAESMGKGAGCLLGGRIPEGAGAFYPPTVLTRVRKGMPVFDEETFGPVAAIIRVKNEREAVRVANDSNFGLGAAVFTQDIERGQRIAAQELEAGSCFVNAFVKSDPRLPFGGIKESGYGRELSSYGIKEFVNIKTVYINQQSPS
jgi:succinate-semialdehyde dehydrogenase/glutarate-semialdehyde dehydrogenase